MLQHLSRLARAAAGALLVLPLSSAAAAPLLDFDGPIRSYAGSACLYAPVEFVPDSPPPLGHFIFDNAVCVWTQVSVGRLLSTGALFADIAAMSVFRPSASTVLPPSPDFGALMDQSNIEPFPNSLAAASFLGVDPQGFGHLAYHLPEDLSPGLTVANAVPERLSLYYRWYIPGTDDPFDRLQENVLFVPLIATPEPATLALTAAGLLALGLGGRRRRVAPRSSP